MSSISADREVVQFQPSVSSVMDCWERGYNDGSMGVPPQTKNHAYLLGWKCGDGDRQTHPRVEVVIEGPSGLLVS